MCPMVREIQTIDGKHLLNRVEAARFLSISVSTLIRWTEMGDIEDIKIRGCRRWEAGELVRIARDGR